MRLSRPRDNRRAGQMAQRRTKTATGIDSRRHYLRKVVVQPFQGKTIASFPNFPGESVAFFTGCPGNSKIGVEAPAKSLSHYRIQVQTSHLLRTFAEVALEDHRVGKLVRGCPKNPTDTVHASETLFWCPDGLPQGHYVSLVSSRLGHRLHECPEIADALRTFLLGLTPHQVVINGSGTTLDQPLQRGCQLFRRRLMQLEPVPEHCSASWIEDVLDHPPVDHHRVFFHQEKGTTDDAVFTFAEQIRILHARAGGNIFRLAEKYGRRAGRKFVMTLVDTNINAPQVIRQLREFGCADWYMYRDTAVESEFHESLQTPGGDLSVADLQTLNGDFLNHWTRAPHRPAPDCNELSQWDDLYFSSFQQDGALATLCRILVQQKLLASGLLVQDRFPVVCFTETPLDQFAGRRVFRPHLSRWDFEPYGISIRRSSLEKLGGKPVDYGTASERDQLPGEEKPWFVVVNSDSTDWSSEREWRVAGDVDLRQLGPDDAVVFVPDEYAAGIAARYSRWPIAILKPSVSSPIG